MDEFLSGDWEVLHLIVWLFLTVGLPLLALVCVMGVNKKGEEDMKMRGVLLDDLKEGEK